MYFAHSLPIWGSLSATLSEHLYIGQTPSAALATENNVKTETRMDVIFANANGVLQVGISIQLFFIFTIKYRFIQLIASNNNFKKKNQ